MSDSQERKTSVFYLGKLWKQRYCVSALTFLISLFFFFSRNLYVFEDTAMCIVYKCVSSSLILLTHWQGAVTNLILLQGFLNLHFHHTISTLESHFNAVVSKVSPQRLVSYVL